ncbi:hypothetical protein [Hydrogenimonas sp.]
MKNVRGSLLHLLFLLFLPLILTAREDYDYELKLGKRSLFIEEPVPLTFRVWRTDPGRILFFEFAPEADRRLEVKLLRERRGEYRGMPSVTFRYLIFPKEAGEIPLRFRFVVKRTSETRLRYNNTGEPVKAKAIDTTDTMEAVPPETLKVAPLPRPVPLVGDYRLEVSVDKRETAAYSPVYLTVRLRGVGAMPEKVDFTPAIENVRVFADEPKIDIRYADDGIHYEGRFSYALLSDHSFVIPPIVLEAFSYTKKRLYRLESEKVAIDVAPVSVETLVDDETRPESVYETLETLKRWGVYTLIFLCGYLSALLVGRLRRTKTSVSRERRFEREVRTARDAKTLLNLLVRTDPWRYLVSIEALERAIYRDDTVDLAKVKKEVLKGENPSRTSR